MSASNKAIWESSKHATPDYAPQYGIHSGGNDFAIIRGENAKELTAQILREHNSHDALVAKLELALRYLEHPDVQAMNFALSSRCVAKRIKQTLAKAREKR